MPSVRVTRLPGLYLFPFPSLSFPPTQNSRACSPRFLPLRSPSSSSSTSFPNDIHSLFLSLFFFLFFSLCLSLRFSLEVSQLQDALGYYYMRAFHPLISRQIRLSSQPLFSFAPLFLSSPFPTPEATLPLAESWTHYVVIYERDNGAWQPSTRGGNPLVSHKPSGRARAVDHRSGSGKPVCFIPCANLLSNFILFLESSVVSHANYEKFEISGFTRILTRDKTFIINCYFVPEIKVHV